MSIPIDIELLDLNNCLIPFTVTSEETIQSVKQRLGETLALDLHESALLFDSLVLRNKYNVEYYGIV